ncbi:MAG: biotin--[acetyl-CoA-carboxylase] ligase [Micromonosporaceae bacterium]
MDAQRPPAAERLSLDAAALTRALVKPGGLWHGITVVAETGSTNTDLLGAAAAGAGEGAVLAAEAQTAARGRMGRRWLNPPRAALTFSVLLRPCGVPVRRRGWVSLLTGVAAVSALRRVAGVDAALKWPNDVLAGERKLAGILTEQSGDAIVAGIGINFSALPPGPAAGRATFVKAEASSPISREGLLVAVLGELERAYAAWTADPDGCGLRERYMQLCATIGRTVRVELPGGRMLVGTAEEVDVDGRLVVRAAGTLTAVSAGDVVHVR